MMHLVSFWLYFESTVIVIIFKTLSFDNKFFAKCQPVLWLNIICGFLSYFANFCFDLFSSLQVLYYRDIWAEDFDASPELQGTLWNQFVRKQEKNDLMQSGDSEDFQLDLFVSQDQIMSMK